MTDPAHEPWLALLWVADKASRGQGGGPGRPEIQYVVDYTPVPVRLTPTEWHLLEVLLRNPGRLLSRRRLLHEV